MPVAATPAGLPATAAERSEPGEKSGGEPLGGEVRESSGDEK